jgi:outer membrane protein
MKKILATLACGVVFASAVSADALRIEGGAGMWQQESKGYLEYKDPNTHIVAKDDSEETTFSQGYVWMFIKHPVPILPNLRVEYVGIENEGKANGSFKNFTTTGLADTKLTMKQYDIVPYYNILDNLGY